MGVRHVALKHSTVHAAPNCESGSFVTARGNRRQAADDGECSFEGGKAIEDMALQIAKREVAA